MTDRHPTRGQNVYWAVETRWGGIPMKSLGSTRSEAVKEVCKV